MADHGGNIDHARRTYGGADWIDLSTGINRVPYPVPALPGGAWTDLPTEAAKAGLLAAAGRAFASAAPAVALAGAQAAIQLVPRLAAPGRARVLAPTYNEHARALRAAGWQVDEVARLADLAGADLAVVVNPNNPDGQRHDPAALLALSRAVGRLIVDESFADAEPALSLAAQAGGPLVVLRSFGKFWGLAGLRLGFAFADGATIAALAAMAGPWPVCGPAIAIGTRALADDGWRARTTARLAGDCARLDGLAATAGWRLVGGCALFRTYDAGEAGAAQDRLARARIWTRIFPWSRGWIRLGLPGDEGEWQRLAAVMNRA